MASCLPLTDLNWSAGCYGDKRQRRPAETERTTMTRTNQMVHSIQRSSESGDIFTESKTRRFILWRKGKINTPATDTFQDNVSIRSVCLIGQSVWWTDDILKLLAWWIFWQNKYIKNERVSLSLSLYLKEVMRLWTIMWHHNDAEQWETKSSVMALMQLVQNVCRSAASYRKSTWAAGQRSVRTGVVKKHVIWIHLRMKQICQAACLRMVSECSTGTCSQINTTSFILSLLKTCMAFCQTVTWYEVTVYFLGCTRNFLC